MPVEYVPYIFGVSTYMIFGMTLTFIEMNAPRMSRCSLCMTNPNRYFFLQLFFWPIIYIAINRVDVFEKIAKSAICCFLMFYLQIFSFEFIEQYLSVWAVIPAILILFFTSPLFFKFLDIPLPA